MGERRPVMNDQHKELADAKVPVRIVLGALWTSTLFVFAYVDILGFWRADVINGALDGKVPGTGIGIDQGFLVQATIYVLIPCLMIPVTLLAPARVARMANILVSLTYLVTVVVSVVGEHWAYYVLGSVVECVLLLAVAAVAWKWPRQTVATSADLARPQPSELARG